MKKTLLSLAAAALMLTTLAPQASADGFAKHPGSKFRLGVDGLVLIPVGDMGDNLGVGIGPAVKFDIHMLQWVSLTARTGIIFHLPKELDNGVETTGMEIPILFGAKLYMDSLFFAAELGPNFVSVKAEAGGISIESDDTVFAGTFSVGYEFGDLDVRAGLWVSDLGEAGDSLEIQVSVGYNFLYF